MKIQEVRSAGCGGLACGRPSRGWPSWPPAG